MVGNLDIERLRPPEAGQPLVRHPNAIARMVKLLERVKSSRANDKLFYTGFRVDNDS